MAAVQVIARLRPPKSENISLWVESHDSQVLYHVDNHRAALAGPGSRKCARFTSPILCEASNSSNQAAAFGPLKSLISDAVCKGISATVLCFGQTGSGKTYTLCGPTPELIAERQNDDERGVLLRSAEEVFHQAKVLSFGPCSRHRKVEVAMSVLEVYCEQPVDLLADASILCKPSAVGNRTSMSGTLRVQMGSTGSVHVNGLTAKAVASSEEVAQNLQLALSRRKTSPTLQNAESSRSHLLVTLDIAVSDLRTGQVQASKVRLVDLAGSEHAKRSQANGERLQEASAINTSLSTLSRVITALVEKQRTTTTGADAGPTRGATGSGLPAGASTRIPYRDSMLTRLLADSLGANNAPCRTAVILCLSPDATDYEQSRSTLEFGERARLVVNRAVEPTVTRMSLLPPSTGGIARAEAEATQYATVLRATAAENELLRQAVTALGLDPAQLLATMGGSIAGQAKGPHIMSRTGSLGSTFSSVDAWINQAASPSVLRSNSAQANTARPTYSTGQKPPTPSAKRAQSAITPSRPLQQQAPTVKTPVSASRSVPAFMKGTASSSAKRSQSADVAAPVAPSPSGQARSQPRPAPASAVPRGRTSLRSGYATPASSKSRSVSAQSSTRSTGMSATRSRSASAGSRSKSALALEAVLGSRPVWEAGALPDRLSSSNASVAANGSTAAALHSGRQAAPPRIALISPLGEVLDCNSAWQESQAQLQASVPGHSVQAVQLDLIASEQPLGELKGSSPHVDAGAVADDFSDDDARGAASPVEAELWPADSDEVEVPLQPSAAAAAPLPVSPTAASSRADSLSRHSSMASILSVEEVVVPWEDEEAVLAAPQATIVGATGDVPSLPSFSLAQGRVSSPGLMFMSPVQEPQASNPITAAASPLFLTRTAVDAASSPFVQTEAPAHPDPMLTEAVNALLVQTSDVQSLQRILRAALAEVASLRVALTATVADNRLLAGQLADNSAAGSSPSAHEPGTDETKFQGHGADELAAASRSGIIMSASGLLSPVGATAFPRSLFSPYSSSASSPPQDSDPLRLVTASAHAGFESMAVQVASLQVELEAARQQCVVMAGELDGEKRARFQAEDLASASEGWCSVLEAQVKDLRDTVDLRQQRLVDADARISSLESQLQQANLSLVEATMPTRDVILPSHVEHDGEEEAVEQEGEEPAAADDIDCDVAAMDVHLMQISQHADVAEAALQALIAEDMQDRLHAAEAALSDAQSAVQGQTARANMAETVLTLMVNKAPDGVQKLRARIDSLEQYCGALEKQLVESDEYGLKLKAVLVAREAALAVQVQQLTAERDATVANLQQVGEEASAQHAELFAQLQSTQESLTEYEFCAFLMRDWALRLLEELETQDMEHAAQLEAISAERKVLSEADVPATVLRVMESHMSSMAGFVAEEGAMLQALADSLPDFAEEETASAIEAEVADEPFESMRLQEAVVSSVIAVLRARAAEVAPLRSTVHAQQAQLTGAMEEISSLQVAITGLEEQLHASREQSVQNDDAFSSQAGQLRLLEASLDQARAQAKASDRLLMERATEMNKMQRKIIALQAASAVSARTSEAKVPLSLLQAAEAQLVDNRQLLEQAAAREADYEYRLAMYDQWAQAIGTPEPCYVPGSTECAGLIPVPSDGAMDVALACSACTLQYLDAQNEALQALADSMDSYEPRLEIMVVPKELSDGGEDELDMLSAEMTEALIMLQGRAEICEAILPVLIGKSSAQITLLQQALKEAYGDLSVAQQKDIASQACIAALRRQQDALSQAIAEHLADLTSYKAKIALENKARQTDLEEVRGKADLYEGWCLQLLEPDVDPAPGEGILSAVVDEMLLEEGEWDTKAALLLARVDTVLEGIAQEDTTLGLLADSCDDLLASLHAASMVQSYIALRPEPADEEEEDGAARAELMEAVVAVLSARANAAAAAHLGVLQLQRTAQALIARLQQQLLATQAALLAAGKSNPAYLGMMQDLQTQVDAANTRACSAIQRAQAAEKEVLSVRGALAALEAVVEASSEGLRQQYAELKTLQAENEDLRKRAGQPSQAREVHPALPAQASEVDEEEEEEEGDRSQEGEAEDAPPWAYAPSKEEQAQKMAKRLAKDMAAVQIQRVQAGWRATEAELRQTVTELQARLESSHKERVEALSALARSKQEMKDLQAVVGTAQAAAAADAKARAGPVALTATPGRQGTRTSGIGAGARATVGKIVAFAGAIPTPAKANSRVSGAGLHDVTTVTRQAVTSAAGVSAPKTALAAAPAPTLPSAAPVFTPAKPGAATLAESSPLTDSSPVTVSSDIDELDLTVVARQLGAAKGGPSLAHAAPLSMSTLGASRLGASAVAGGANDTVLGINGSMLLMSPALNLTGLGLGRSQVRSEARHRAALSPVHMFGAVPEEEDDGQHSPTPALQQTRPLPPITGQLIAAAMAVSPIDMAGKQRFTSPPQSNVLGMRSPSLYNLASPTQGKASTSKMNQSAVKMYNRAISAEGRAMSVVNDENRLGLDLANLV